MKNEELMNRKLLALSLSLLVLSGCAAVDMTKTAQGTFAATNPNAVEVLKTRPEKSYTELATFTVTGYSSNDTAKMHNAMREKAAPLGANAVIITAEGMIPRTFGLDQWATGVAIRFK